MNKFFFLILTLISFPAAAQQVQLRVPISHTGSVQGVSISPDNKYVITAGADKTLKLWETSSGTQIKSLELNDKADRQAKFMSDNRHVMVQTDSGWQYWDVIAGKREFSFNGFNKYPGEKMGFCISKDGTQGIVYRQSSIELYNAVNGTLIRSYSYTNTEDYFYIGFRRMNKDFFINVNYGVSSRVLNKKTGEVFLIQLPEGSLSYFDISPTENFLFLSTGDIFYKVNLETKQVEKLPLSGYGREIAISDDGTKLLKGNNTIYTLSSLQEEGFVSDLSGYDCSICLNASYMVSFDNASGNGDWVNTKQRKIIRHFSNETNWLLRLSINQKDGQLVFTTGANEFRIWNLGTYTYEKDVKMKQAQSASFGWYQAGFTEQSHYYVADGYYGKYVYDAATGDKIFETKQSLKAVSYDATAGAFDDNGNGTIRNLNTDEVLAQTEYTYPQFSFSPDNKHVVYYSTVPNAARHIINYKTKKDIVMNAVIGDDLTYNAEGTRLYTTNINYYCVNCEPTITATDIETGATLNSVTVPAEKGMRVSEIAVSADEKYVSLLYMRSDEFYMASNNVIVTYAMATGKETGRCVKVNGDEGLAYWGKTYLLTTISQRTNLVEVWDAMKGKNLVNITHFKGENDWIAVTPEGFYDGNMESLRKFYFVKGNEVVDPDLYFEKFYTPDLFARIVNGETFTPDDTGLKGIPKVQMKYASASRNLEVDEDIPTYQNTTGTAEITVTATAPDDAIDEIRLFHNGKIVTLTTRNLFVDDDSKSNTQTKKYTVNLLPGVNTFRAVALNTQRTESRPDELAVIYNAGGSDNNSSAEIINNTDGAPVMQVDKNATMYLVVVGINQYQNQKLSLNYALADATSFKEEVEKDAKTVISNIQTWFVKDNDAVKANIENAFNEVKQKAKPEDVFVFYYAGHGVIGNNNEFYLVPSDISDLKNVQSELEQKGIAAKLLQQYAIDIQAQKQLFILDACQSAGAFEAMLSGDANKQKSIAVVARSTGTHWIAASGAQQYANEFSSLGHGAFTYVLLEALNRAASKNDMITVNNLKNYLQQAVPELMKKYHGSPQYPSSYGFGNDFPVKH